MAYLHWDIDTSIFGVCSLTTSHYGDFMRQPWGSLLSYFLIPFITLAVCTLLYKGLNRLTPRLLSIITGGRS